MKIKCHFADPLIGNAQQELKTLNTSIRLACSWTTTCIVLKICIRTDASSSESLLHEDNEILKLEAI